MNEPFAFYWVIEGRAPKPAPTMVAWWASQENIDARIVARAVLGDAIVVSTVFTGLNLRVGEGTPLVFETMIFRRAGGAQNPFEVYARYDTWTAAEAGHRQALQTVGA